MVSLFLSLFLVLLIYLMCKVPFFSFSDYGPWCDLHTSSKWWQGYSLNGKRSLCLGGSKAQFLWITDLDQNQRGRCFLTWLPQLLHLPKEKKFTEIQLYHPMVTNQFYPLALIFFLLYCDSSDIQWHPCWLRLHPPQQRRGSFHSALDYMLCSFKIDSREKLVSSARWLSISHM